VQRDLLARQMIGDSWGISPVTAGLLCKSLGRGQIGVGPGRGRERHEGGKGKQALCHPPGLSCERFPNSG
jgi:hypothetical protein